jgi:hypothetical protein
MSVEITISIKAAAAANQRFRSEENSKTSLDTCAQTQYLYVTNFNLLFERLFVHRKK